MRKSKGQGQPGEWLRVCARCEWIYRGEGHACPKCEFVSYGAFWVYGGYLPAYIKWVKQYFIKGGKQP